MCAYHARGSCVANGFPVRIIEHSAGESPPSTSLKPTEPSHRPQPTTVYAREDRSLRQTSGYRTQPLRSPSPVKGSLLLLIGAIHVAPIGTVVSAAPCPSTTTTSISTGGIKDAQQLSVTPTTRANITSVFDCEGGDFDVYWSGAVNVTGTIVIGRGTTVRIFGDVNSSESDSSVSNNEGLEELTSGLALPRGLTSAAVGVGSPEITANTDTGVSFGPMFFVDGGELFLQDLIVRGGFAVNTTRGLEGIGGVYGNGGGVHAVNRSTVSVARCEFIDNFAEHWGGGIFANQSTLRVVDSTFRNCHAGYLSTIEDEDLEGEGGGFLVRISHACNVRISELARSD